MQVNLWSISQHNLTFKFDNFSKLCTPSDMNIHIVCMLNNTCIYVLFLKCLAVGLVSEVGGQHIIKTTNNTDFFLQHTLWWSEMIKCNPHSKHDVYLNVRFLQVASFNHFRLRDLLSRGRICGCKWAKRPSLQHFLDINLVCGVNIYLSEPFKTFQ